MVGACTWDFGLHAVSVRYDDTSETKLISIGFL